MLALVAAVAENGVIGAGNRLPWRLPADLRHFKTLTMGKPILMGRKTYQSIGKPLPGRRNLVLTHDRSFGAAGIETVLSLDEAIVTSAQTGELMVIGGAEIYRLALPKAERIYFTHVHAAVPGDTYFPDYVPAEWREVERREYPQDRENAFPMTFLTLERLALSSTQPTRRTDPKTQR